MRNPFARLVRRLAADMAGASYAFERLNARLYDAPWNQVRNRAGRPC